MLIGIDGFPLTELRTGVGHYTFELARALAAASPGDLFELAYPSKYSTFTFPEFATDLPNLTACSVPVGIFGKHWWSTVLPAHIKRRGFDLFHGTNFDVPLWNRCPTVSTIHDLSPLLYPDTHEVRAVRRARRRLPVMSRAATMIITPTESVRHDVCDVLGVDRAKVVAVPEAPRPLFRAIPIDQATAITSELGIDVMRPFLLAVGTIEPRKNLRTLLGAFQRILRDRSGTELQLVVTGNEGWLNREFFDEVATSPVRERIHFTGYVSDLTLRALYSSCAAFVYPSLYEGFGLPPVEAMACGAPVIASRVAAHSEVLGEEAAYLFDPTDAEALARCIADVIDDPETAQRLRTAGQQRVRHLTWDASARQTREVYAEAVKRNAKV